MADLSRRHFIGRSGALVVALAAASAGSPRFLAEALGATADLTPARRATYTALVRAVVEPRIGSLEDEELEAAAADFAQWFGEQPDEVRGAVALVLDRIEQGAPGGAFSTAKPADNAAFLHDWEGARTSREGANDERLRRDAGRLPGKGEGGKATFYADLAEQSAAIEKRQREIVKAYGEHALRLDHVTLLPRWRPDGDGEKPVKLPDETRSEAHRLRSTAIAARQLAGLPFGSNVERPGP